MQTGSFIVQSCCNDKEELYFHAPSIHPALEFCANCLKTIQKLSCSVHFHFKHGKSTSVWPKRNIFQP